MIAGEIVVLLSIAVFFLGTLAGKQIGKERCIEKMKVILDEYGFKYDDENNGDA